MLLSYIPDRNKIKDWQKIEETFFVEDFLSENRDEIYKQLNSYFKTASISDILFFKNTYWKLFVYAAWNLFNALPPEDIKRAISLQIPDAIDLDFDVVDKILWHLGLIYMSIDEQREIYQQMKDGFFGSEMIFGMEDGKQIKISEIINEILNLNIAGDNSIQVAKLLSRMNKLRIDSNISSKFVYKDLSGSAKDFFNLMQFFIGIDADNVPYIVHNSLNAHRSFKGKGGSVGAIIETSRENVLRETPSLKILAEEKPFLVEFPKHKTDFTSWITGVAALRSLLLWLGSFEDKTQARREFSKNLKITLGDDSLANNDLVLAIARLDEFLAKNSYPGDDFFYFEEASGKFKWGGNS